MKHVISLLVENHQGVLARIAGLFSGRGYNMESLTAGVTIDPSISRITIVCRGDDSVISQIRKQLSKLIDTVKVVDLTDAPSVNRELALFKVKAKTNQRGEIFQVADVFSAQVLDVGTNAMVLEITGAPEKIDDFANILLPYGVVEMARSGLVSVERSPKTVKQP